MEYYTCQIVTNKSDGNRQKHSKTCQYTIQRAKHSDLKPAVFPKSQNTCLAVIKWICTITMLDDSCLHNSWCEIGHKYPRCLFQFFFFFLSLCLEKSMLQDSQDNYDRIIFPWQNQHKTNNWIRIALLELGKQISTMHVNGIAVLHGWSWINCVQENWHTPPVQPEINVLWLHIKKKNKTLLYILTTRRFRNLCFLFYPISIVRCIYTGTGETLFTVWHWYIVLRKKKKK